MPNDLSLPGEIDMFLDSMCLGVTYELFFFKWIEQNLRDLRIFYVKDSGTSLFIWQQSMKSHIVCAVILH